MAQAIRGLQSQKPPSAARVAGLLSGLETITGRASARFHAPTGS